MDETIFTNARIVVRDRIVSGTLVVRDGLVAEISEGRSGAPATDLDGDYLLPGLVELHTDNMEKYFSPRPGVRWPALSAAIAHDAQVAAAGITTVLDALAVGDVREGSTRIEQLNAMVEAVIQAGGRGALRAQHFLHLRCEVSFPKLVELFEGMADLPSLKLVSIMDHTPGQRQFVSLDKYRQYYQGKYGMTDAEMDAFMTSQIALQEQWSDSNRRTIVAMARDRKLPLASHDDATDSHVADAVEDGMVVAEFPTTELAADLSRRHGMKVLMGAPNLVRGGSHSGNVSARALAEKGLLDVISSDYVPASLLHSAFQLARDVPAIGLAGAVAMASANPAESVGLSDRGEIAPGKRADLIQVRDLGEVPLVRTVWREGNRVA